MGASVGGANGHLGLALWFAKRTASKPSLLNPVVPIRSDLGCCGDTKQPLFELTPLGLVLAVVSHRSGPYFDLATDLMFAIVKFSHQDVLQIGTIEISL